METPHPSTTYSEWSKEEDELAEDIRKLESDFCDRGTLPWVHIWGVSEPAHRRTCLVLGLTELLVIKTHFTYKNTADVLPKIISEVLFPLFRFYTFRNRRLRYIVNSAKYCFTFLKPRVEVPLSASWRKGWESFDPQSNSGPDQTFVLRVVNKCLRMQRILSFLSS